MMKLPHPPLFEEGTPLRYAVDRLAPGDIRATREQRDAYLRYTRVGDPPADEVVAMIRRLPTGIGRAMFDTAVDHGIDAIDDAPPELVAFFRDHVDQVPYWVDQDQLDLGCRVVGRTGVTAGFTALAMLGLMGGYMASRVVKTLTATGDLDKIATRRLAETTAWACDVTTVGGLRRFAPGTKGTLRVRLMHAQVRAGLSRNPRWQLEAWDHPINQSQMAGTTMLFALANLAGAQAMGMKFTQKEKDGVYHLWRYVGHLLGVAPDIAPTTEMDYWRLLWLQADYEFRAPDNDSVRMAQSLVRALGPTIVGERHDMPSRLARHAVTQFNLAFAQLTLGESNAATLGLTSSKSAQAAVMAAAAAIRIMEYPRMLMPGATSRRELRGHAARQALARRMMALHNGDRTYSRAHAVT